MNKAEWIAVSEKTPLDFQRVFATDGTFVFEAHYARGEWFRNGNNFELWTDTKVTHWTTLPPPPRKSVTVSRIEVIVHGRRKRT